MYQILMVPSKKSNRIKISGPIKTIKQLLAPYTDSHKLSGYSLLNHHNKLQLLLNKTRIKIISINDVFSGEYSEDHIGPGGLLIHYGKFIGEIFVSTNCIDQWQWLMLRINQSQIDNVIISNKNTKIIRNGDSTFIFVDLSKNYIFFRPARS